MPRGDEEDSEVREDLRGLEEVVLVQGWEGVERMTRACAGETSRWGRASGRGGSSETRRATSVNRSSKSLKWSAPGSPRARGCWSLCAFERGELLARDLVGVLQARLVAECWMTSSESVRLRSRWRHLPIRETSSSKRCSVSLSKGSWSRRVCSLTSLVGRAARLPRPQSGLTAECRRQRPSAASRR